jgi:CcmD family protein
MPSLEFLFAAYTIAWVIMFGYFMVIARRMRELRREIEALREEVTRQKADGREPSTTGTR